MHVTLDEILTLNLCVCLILTLRMYVASSSNLISQILTLKLPNCILIREIIYQISDSYKTKICCTNIHKLIFTVTVLLILLQDLWRLTIKNNQYLVMRCPISPYCRYVYTIKVVFCIFI